MTNIILSGGDTPGTQYLSGYSNLFSYSSLVSANATSYVYTSTVGRTVTLTGTDIVVNGSGRFVSGNITGLTVSAASGPSNSEIEFTDLNVDGTDLLGSNGSDIPSLADIWVALFDGSVTMTGVNSPGILLGMDGNIANAGSYQGGDSVVRGEFFGTSYISGAFNQVNDTAIIYGGEMDFKGFAAFVVGDVYYTQDTVRLIGGDDTIVLTDFSRSDIGTSNAYFTGDADQINDETIAVGGDDNIDARNIESFDGTLRISGDFRLVANGTVVAGGDDNIRGSRTLDNIISGDQLQNSNLNNFVGGDDTITGGAGDDILYGDIGSETVSGSAGGDDIIYGGGGDDVMVGSGGRDAFFKGTGAATIYGGNGDDSFRPNASGAHTFYGGSGDDLVDYSRAPSAIRIDLQNPSDRSGWVSDDVLDSIEDVIGTSKGDFIFGSTEDNEISAGAGSDFVAGRGGGDVIKLGKGTDTVEAASGANTYFGDKGTDLIDYANSNAGVKINLNAKTAKGGYAEGDKIRSMEDISGSQFADVLTGTDGKNSLKGRDGGDKLVGGQANDKLAGDKGGDDLFGGKGNDDLKGGKGSDFMVGGLGKDVATGGDGADTFHFDKNTGELRITDFENNTDLIEVDGYNNPFNKATAVDGDVIFDFGGGNRLIVEDVTINQLQNDLNVV